MISPWSRSPGGSFNDPEPGEHVDLVDLNGDLDGRETRIRQVIASDDRAGVHEVRDDRGVVIYITAGETLGTWVQVLEA